MALDKTIISQKQTGFLVEISVGYEELETTKHYIKTIGAKITSIEYGEKVIILLEISKQNYEENLLNYNNRVKNCITLKILQEKNIDISTNTQKT